MNYKTLKILFLSLVATASMSTNAQITETATEAVQNMGVGWNLGNTLDANGQSVTDATKDNYWGGQGIDSETYWGQPVTTPAVFTLMKNAGFGAIRIPVTWYNHMDKTGTVKAEWMKRVHEVVDYAISNGLYVILNVHHDTGADSNTFKSWIKADESNYNTNKTRYEYLWKQIAEEFKEYDHHLLFEGYNEMLDTKSSWCFASFNSTNSYNAALATSAYNGINNYAQSFVNTVRATGGNNASRNLVVCTYAAANGDGTWNSHLQDPLKNMALPNDAVKDHIIFEVHTYPSLTTTSSSGTVSNRTISDIRKDIDRNISYLKSYLTSKGAPVIFGEWGTSNVDAGAGKTDYDARRELMLQFAKYFVQATKKNGIGTFYWMGLSDGLYRNLGAFSQPDLAECLVKAYYGDDFEGVYPDIHSLNRITCFEGAKTLNWGAGITIPASMINSIGPDVQLELEYKQLNSSDIMQFYLADWSEKITFSIGTRSYSEQFSPHSLYGYGTATRTTIITLPHATFAKAAQKGILIHGIGISIAKATLINPNATAIHSITEYPSTDNTIYNLNGQRISKPSHGLYIQGGKKYLAK